MPEVTIPVVNNLPIKRLQHGNLTVEGYSRAAVQTYWRIPELKIGFDLGAQPWLFMGDPQMVRLAWTHGPHRGAARLHRTAADDENDSADHLSSRGDRRTD